MQTKIQNILKRLLQLYPKSVDLSLNRIKRLLKDLNNPEREIKKAKIPTFAVAARAVAGGTYASNFFMHDFIIIESKCVENLLFSGKRVTANILKGTDQIPDDFGTGPGIMKSGLADITLENRKELKDTIIKLANIVLKKEVQKINNVEEAHENPEDFKKTASTAS